MTRSRYRLYGLVVESPFELSARAADGAPADVLVTWGEERDVPDDLPAGDVLSSIALGQLRYSTTRTSSGHVIRFPGTCDVVVDAGLRRVELIVADAERRTFVETLFAGSILATILTLRGECVLHASAVAVEGAAVAYVGPPGRGKSTVAALACAAGARLVTDDVLRLVPRDGGWAGFTGTSSLRLRQQAAPVAELFGEATYPTADERIGVALPPGDDEVPLKALVFPLPSRAAHSLEIRRLDGHDAFMRLTSFPRVLGWKDEKVIADGFRWNARLAREVPSYEAVVPWGPPFDPAIVAELVRRVGAGNAA